MVSQRDRISFVKRLHRAALYGLLAMVAFALLFSFLIAQGSALHAAPDLLCLLADRRIVESSGLAASARNPDVFWTHNDSGDDARLYAFNSQGKDLGAFALPGVQAHDWEDVASFVSNGRTFLLIADTGDNAARRELCTLLIVEEPDLQAQGGHELRLVRRIVLTYEDGPRDCEAVAVDAAAGVILLVDKNLHGPWCGIYAVPLEAQADTAEVKARRLLQLPLWCVTAMDISADGRHAALISHRTVYEFDREPGEPWAKAFARQARIVAELPKGQWEGLCYARDGSALFVSCEGSPAQIWKIRIR